MKSIKKLFVAALAFTASFFMINAVLAEEAATKPGSITIEGTTEGKVYEAYKIFDLTKKGEGKTAKVAYTIDSNWTGFFATGGAGAKYIVSENNEAKTLNQITIGSETKYINITEDNVAEFSQKALVYLVANKTTVPVAGTATGPQAETEKDRVATISNLDLGYYLVYPQGATDKVDANGSIASLTSTLPTAKVVVKATYPTIEKTVSDKYVDVGQVVTFTITGKVPDTTSYSTYTYKVTDTMSDGLAFDLDTSVFTIKFGETIITDTTTTPFTLVQNGNGFVLNFDMTKYQAYVGQTITITYNATVTEAAVANNEVKNDAFLTYTNNPKTGEEKDTPHIKVPVYSSAVQVKKVDAKDNTIKLAGAEFVLSKVIIDKETQNKITVYYQAFNKEGNKITNLSTTAGVVEVKWVTDKNAATLLVTDTNGIALFKGVENGTYSLEEIKAPEGYNKLTGPVTVKVGYNQEETNITEVAVTKEATIQNNTGIALPGTGGMGTTLFIVIGSLLAIISAIVLITNKRMAKEFE